MNNDDWERIKNAGLGLGPSTDAELEEIAPIAMVIVVILVIGFVIYKLIAG